MYTRSVVLRAEQSGRPQQGGRGRSLLSVSIEPLHSRTRGLVTQFAAPGLPPRRHRTNRDSITVELGCGTATRMRYDRTCLRGLATVALGLGGVVGCDPGEGSRRLRRARPDRPRWTLPGGDHPAGAVPRGERAAGPHPCGGGPHRGSGSPPATVTPGDGPVSVVLSRDGAGWRGEAVLLLLT